MRGAGCLMKECSEVDERTSEYASEHILNRHPGRRIQADHPTTEMYRGVRGILGEHPYLIINDRA